MTTATPAAVIDYREELRQITGHGPCVLLEKPGVWGVSITTPRVIFETRFSTNLTSSSTRVLGTTLTVDGELREAPCCPDCLIRILDDPDFANRSVALDPPPARHNVDRAPAMLRHNFHVLARRLSGRNDCTMVVGVRETNRWVLALDVPNGGIRLTAHHVQGRWVSDPARDLQVVVAGHDMSQLVDGSLEKAVGVLVGLGEDARGVPGQLGRSCAAGSRPRSVDVRATAVLRS